MVVKQACCMLGGILCEAWDRVKWEFRFHLFVERLVNVPKNIFDIFESD